MEEKALRYIAAQLSSPHGEDGVDIAKKMNESNQFVTEQAIEKLSAQRSEFIVEIGPGNAHLSQPILQSIGSGGRYLGLEMSETMVAEAQKVLSPFGAEHTVICVDCRDAHVEHQSIDAVISVNVLYFIENLTDFFKQIVKWLKPGGRVVWGLRSDKTLANLPFTQYGFHIRSINAVLTLMEKAGFVELEKTVYDEGLYPFDDILISLDAVIVSGKTPG